MLLFSFADDGCLAVGEGTEGTKMRTPVSVSFSGSAGLSCGEWLSFGGPDLPGDQVELSLVESFLVMKYFQRSVAAYHACWRSPVLTEPLHILGRAEVRLSLVELLHYCALIGRELDSAEIFSPRWWRTASWTLSRARFTLPSAMSSTPGGEELDCSPTVFLISVEAREDKK